MKNTAPANRGGADENSDGLDTKRDSTPRRPAQHGIVDDDLAVPPFLQRTGTTKLVDGEIACRVCGNIVTKKTAAQRFCGKACRQAAYRIRITKKSRRNAPKKCRLYPPTRVRNKNAKKPKGNNGSFWTPKVAKVVSGHCPLSAVELLALGIDVLLHAVSPAPAHIRIDQALLAAVWKVETANYPPLQTVEPE